MKAAIRIFLMCLCAAGFAVFFAPVCVYGVFNLGNGSAMAFFAAAFLCLLFYKRAGASARRLWRRRGYRAAMCAAAGLFAAALLAGGVIGVQVIRGALNAPPEGEPLTAVLLGCRVYDSGPSLMLRTRLDAAYEYLAAHPQAKCVLSGGQGEDEPVSEARSMFEALIARGIDPARLILEERSRTTEENLRYSAELIKEQGLPEGMALITNEYHARRAQLFAAAADVPACYAVSAASPRIMLPTYFVREIWGIAYGVLTGSLPL